jgi:acetyl-CoA carboxylase carboxyltransferase component
MNADAEKKHAALSPEEQAAFKQPILDKYETEGNPYYSTARIWDDGIIDPLDTRAVLAIGLRAARYKAPKETKFGVFRM